jgi:hypothetical protein
MPRISNAQTQERSTFLLELIRNQPDISREDAQERFEEKFDATLNPKLFQQLRDQAQQEQRSAPAAEEPSQDENDSAGEDTGTLFKASSNGASEASNGNGASSQPAKAKAAKGARQKNVFVDATKEQLVFLERIVQQLQEAGASNVRIDHSTDRWMVLVVDAK